MHSTIIRHVVWKEYRIQRPLWLTIAVFTFLLQLLVLIVSVLNGSPTPYEALFGLALAMPAVYALANGATLFAAERETETYDFQRSLPLTAGQMTGGKLLFGIASSWLLMLTMWCVAWVLSAGELPRPEDHAMWWAFGGVALLEVFAWATFFSLLVHRVIWAAILGAAAALLIGFYAVPAAAIEAFGRGVFGPDEYASTLPYRAAFAALVLAADVWLGRRWFRAESWWAGLLERLGLEVREPASGLVTHPKTVTALAHLIWQAWRQMRGAFSAILIGNLVLNGFLIYRILTESRRADFVFATPLLFLPFVTALIASSMFWSDQRREMFQFFAERGISARMVWLSRHCVAIVFVLLWVLLTICGIGLEMVRTGATFHWADVAGPHVTEAPVAFQIPPRALILLGATVGLSLLSYAVGQTASLLFRSGVIGSCVGLFACMMAAMWASLIISMQVPLWFSVAPIPLILLVGSWWIAPAVFRGEINWRVRLKIIAGLMLPLLMVGAGVAGFRAFEIPALQPQLPLDAFLKTPSEDAVDTAAMYSDAMLTLHTGSASTMPLEPQAGVTVGDPDLPNAPQESNAVSLKEKEEQTESAIQQFVAASQRPTCWFPTTAEHAERTLPPPSTVATGPLYRREGILPAADQILASCRRLEGNGELDEAWQRYVALLHFSHCLHERADWTQQMLADTIEVRVLDRLPQWAAHPAQTAPRIREAAGELETEFLAQMPPRISGVVDEYLRLRRWIDFEPSAWQRQHASESERRAMSVLTTLFPWEYVRTERKLNYSSETARRTLEELNRNLDGGGYVGYPRSLSSNPRERRWLSGTLFSAQSGNTYIVERQMINLAARRRAVRLQLALLGWKAEHGEYPESLADLCGPDLDRVPLDPYSGLAYQFLRDGVAITLHTRPSSILITGPVEGGMTETIAVGQPLLWIPGPSLRYRPQHTWDRKQYSFSISEFLHQPLGAAEGRPLVIEEQLWELGWCFPLPTTEDR